MANSTSTETDIMTINITLVGASAVGKTAMMNRLIDNKYDGGVSATIGTEYRIATLHIPDGRRIKARIWDTAGAERFRTIAVSYLRFADGVFFVYDVTSRNSFEAIESWYRSSNEHMPQSAITVLVGHKADDGNDSKRQVSTEQGERMAQRHGSYFVETSSLSDIGVQESFNRMAELVVQVKDAEQHSRDLLEQSEGDGAGGEAGEAGEVLPPTFGAGLVFSQAVEFVRQRFQDMTGTAQQVSGSDSRASEEPRSAVGSQDRHLWLVPELEAKSLKRRIKNFEQEHTLLKILVTGPGSGGIGKTALIRRFVEKSFLASDFQTTIGMTFHTTSIVIDNHERFKLQIFDTPSAWRFRSLVHAYSKEKDGVLLVYDIGDVASFEGLNSWRREVEQFSPSAKFVLVGLKCDRGDAERQVSRAQGEALAKEWSCPFFEASAKLDVNVTECFYQLTAMIAEAKALFNMRYGDGAGDGADEGVGGAQQGVFRGVDFDIRGAMQTVLQKLGS